MRHLLVSVEDTAELLDANAYGAGALLRWESSPTVDGTYVEGGTVALVAGQEVYEIWDAAGVASTSYRTRVSDAAATTFSAYSATSQEPGLLCSVDDVKDRMFGTQSTNDSDDGLILSIIREVSDDIEDYVGAWLAPRPADPASTMTLLLDVEQCGRELELRSGGRRVGIRTLTALGLARTSQPEVGGTYTDATLADILLRPRPTADAPASMLRFSDYPTGPFAAFEAGYNTVRATGSFGPAAVAPRFQRVAISAVTRRFIGKETAAPAVQVGPDGGVRLLADISPGDKATLDRIRGGKVG